MPPKPEIRPDDLRRRDQPEAEIDEAERETLAEHPEGSAPPLDRLTQEQKPDQSRD